MKEKSIPVDFSERIDDNASREELLTFADESADFLDSFIETLKTN